MISKLFVVICILFPQVLTDSNRYSFPEEFLFGVATAAYQIEGAFDEDGKTYSIWDYNLHKNPDWVKDRANGDVACDSYHKWKEDIQLVKALGANFYRMSIAWTRILPSGHAGSQINEKAVLHYNNIINELISEGLIPMITIYHWDLPQSLQEIGGWMNPDIIDHYVFYAQTVFNLFGDRVKHWITFNEPYHICEEGYSGVSMAPFFNASGIGGYLCSHNVLLSHGKIYRLYEKLYKPSQNGKISITMDTTWYEAKDQSSDSDKEAAQRKLQFNYGWYMHPLVKGNYPAVMIERIDKFSEQEGFPKSRLPKFTESEIEMIRGSYDFLGLNHYSTSLAEPSQNFNQPSQNYDTGVQDSGDPEWEVSKTSPWLKDVPWGLRKLLVWIKEEYRNPPLFIFENGWSSTSGLMDEDRVRYINGYLSELLKAIHEDGCNVLGYTHWSLLDNFEWLSGYSARFGLVEVDFNSRERTRTPRLSYRVYQNIIKSRIVN
ncbi:hypothetical protein WA026_000581 [Henosepilachna vigintioctopunctata]|uniref:Beta-glucosidase n=1 Tax=Henosepilachna vigintioctopunctata TaxID=420089 RepID=A0AAW1UZR0_9CUCU